MATKTSTGSSGYGRNKGSIEHASELRKTPPEKTKSKYFTGKGGSIVPLSKRSHSEMANSSAEEMTLVLEELSEIKNEMMKGDKELTEIKRDMMKKDDMKEMVTSIVHEMMKRQKEEFEARLQENDEKNRKEHDRLTEMIEAVNLENESLKRS